MPEISIDAPTFARLQRHARPFIDSPQAVVAKALDALEEVQSRGESVDRREHLLDPESLPSLTHTKVLEARLDGVVVERPNWNRLVRELVVLAHCRLRDFGQVDFGQLCRTIPVNMVERRKDDDGYEYLDSIGISVQAQDANDACRSLLVGARQLRISLDVHFLWRMKARAAHPGELGRLRLD